MHRFDRCQTDDSNFLFPCQIDTVQAGLIAIMPLSTIVYVSSSTMPFSHCELEDLSLKLKFSDREHSITGALLYNDGNFIECIEGRAPEIGMTYDRILKDKRHDGIIELLNHSIPFRAFDSWEMRFGTRLELTKAISSTSSKANNKTHPSLILMKGFISRAVN